MGDNFGIHRGPKKGAAANSAADAEDRTQGQIMSDFLVQLEDYNPTVCLLVIMSMFEFSVIPNIIFYRSRMPSLRTISTRPDLRLPIRECESGLVC